MFKNVYENNEVTFIEEYSDALRKGLVLQTTKDLENKNVLAKYDSWIKKLIEINPKEYTSENFDKLTVIETSEICLEIILKIFNEDILEDYANFIKTLIVTNENRILDGVCANIIRKQDRQTHGVVSFIPNNNITTSPVVLLHEFLHYLEISRKIDLNKKRYYKEILSLYAEKYAIKHIAKICDDKEFEKKVESTRTEIIVWHNTYKIDDIKGLLNLYKFAKEQEDYNIISTIEERIPFVKTKQGIENMQSYYRSLRDSYGIGYLFGNELYKKSLEDENKFKAKLNSVLTKEITLEELLRFYNISTKNFKMYDDNITCLRKTLK